MSVADAAADAWPKSERGLDANNGDFCQFLMPGHMCPVSIPEIEPMLETSPSYEPV